MGFFRKADMFFLVRVLQSTIPGVSDSVGGLLVGGWTNPFEKHARQIGWLWAPFQPMKKNGFWPPKTMKNRGFGHLKTQVFTISTSKNCRFWGFPWCIQHQHLPSQVPGPTRSGFGWRMPNPTLGGCAGGGRGGGGAGAWQGGRMSFWTGRWGGGG